MSYYAGLNSNFTTGVDAQVLQLGAFRPGDERRVLNVGLNVYYRATDGQKSVVNMGLGRISVDNRSLLDVCNESGKGAISDIKNIIGFIFYSCTYFIRDRNGSQDSMIHGYAKKGEAISFRPSESSGSAVVVETRGIPTGKLKIIGDVAVPDFTEIIRDQQLGQPIGSGAEARVYRFSHDAKDYVVKVLMGSDEQERPITYDEALAEVTERLRGILQPQDNNSADRSYKVFTAKQNIVLMGVRSDLGDNKKEFALRILRTVRYSSLIDSKYCTLLKGIAMINHDGVDRVGLVYDYYNGGNLWNILSEGITAIQMVTYMRMVCVSLRNLHSYDLIHRDLKPDNVFVMRSNDGSIKSLVIGDLGLTRMAPCRVLIAANQQGLNMTNSTNGNETEMTRNTGTNKYMAPEVGSGVYSKAVDIYSFGVIMRDFLGSCREISERRYSHVKTRLEVLAESCRGDCYVTRPIVTYVDYELEAIQGIIGTIELTRT